MADVEGGAPPTEATKETEAKTAQESTKEQDPAPESTDAEAKDAAPAKSDAEPEQKESAKPDAEPDQKERSKTNGSAGSRYRPREKIGRKTDYEALPESSDPAEIRKQVRLVCTSNVKTLH